MKNHMPLFFIILIVIVIGFSFTSSFFNQHKQVLSLSTGGPTTTHILSQNLYPHPDMTPGDVFPDVAVTTVCTKGYTQEVRNVSIETKRQVYAEYGLPYPQLRGAYETDHFIPLELGGSNDIKNLWPEPANPTPGFHEKDIVENYLHDQVCQHGESLPQAQQEIKADWYAVYQRIPNPQLYIY